MRRCSIQKFVRINERIRAEEVRVIGPEAEQLGVLMLKRALEMAQAAELDLVEIAPSAEPPVCRIMDYSKFKYDQEKKERRIKKKQHVTHLKQIRLKPHIAESDFQTKLKQAIGFLGKKDKVKLNMMFRGREISHQGLGKEILERMMKELAEYGQAESSLAFEGRVMYVVFTPASAKGAEKKS